MSIQDVSKVTRKPGEPVYANSFEADLARLESGKAQAVKQGDTVLIEFYDKKIAHLKAVNTLNRTTSPTKKTKKKKKR